MDQRRGTRQPLNDPHDIRNEMLASNIEASAIRPRRRRNSDGGSDIIVYKRHRKSSPAVSGSPPHSPVLNAVPLQQYSPFIGPSVLSTPEALKYVDSFLVNETLKSVVVEDSSSGKDTEVIHLMSDGESSQGIVSISAGGCSYVIEKNETLESTEGESLKGIGLGRLRDCSDLPFLGPFQSQTFVDDGVGGIGVGVVDRVEAKLNDCESGLVSGDCSRGIGIDLNVSLNVFGDDSDFFYHPIPSEGLGFVSEGRVSTNDDTCPNLSLCLGGLGSSKAGDCLAETGIGSVDKFPKVVVQDVVETGEGEHDVASLVEDEVNVCRGDDVGISDVSTIVRPEELRDGYDGDVIRVDEADNDVCRGDDVAPDVCPIVSPDVSRSPKAIDDAVSGGVVCGGDDVIADQVNSVRADDLVGVRDDVLVVDEVVENSSGAEVCGSGYRGDDECLGGNDVVGIRVARRPLTRSLSGALFRSKNVDGPGSSSDDPLSVDEPRNADDDVGLNDVVNDAVCEESSGKDDFVKKVKLRRSKRLSVSQMDVIDEEAADTIGADIEARGLTDVADDVFVGDEHLSDVCLETGVDGKDSGRDFGGESRVVEESGGKADVDQVEAEDMELGSEHLSDVCLEGPMFVVGGKKKRTTHFVKRGSVRRSGTGEQVSAGRSDVVEEPAVQECQTSPDVVELGAPIKGFNYEPNKLKTRLTSSPLCEIIDMFSNAQKLAICELGFGGFLKVSCNKLPTLLPAWLVHHFDTKSCCIRWFDVVDHIEKQLPITEEDVHLCLGLPKGRKRIVLPNSDSDNTDGFNDFCLAWRKQYGNVIPATTSMPKVFLEQTDGGDDFKRNFTVFIFSSFFMAGSTVACKIKSLKTCMNVSEVCKFNWCEFVVRHLVERVEMWRRNPRSMFTGPIFILMMIFLDRVTLKDTDRLVPRVFPTVCGWTAEKADEYVKICKSKGGLGQGVICPRVDKSVDWMPSASYYQDLMFGGKRSVDRNVSENVQNTSSNSNVLSDFKCWMDEMKDSSGNVAKALEHFQGVLEDGFSKFGPNNAFIQLRNSASNLFKSFLSFYVGASSAQGEGCNEALEPSPSDDLFSDPDVVTAICYLADAAERMVARRNKDPNVPSFRLLNTQDEETAIAASLNLDVDFVDDRVKSARPKRSGVLQGANLVAQSVSKSSDVRGLKKVAGGDSVGVDVVGSVVSSDVCNAFAGCVWMRKLMKGEEGGPVVRGVGLKDVKLSGGVSFVSSNFWKCYPMIKKRINVDCVVICDYIFTPNGDHDNNDVVFKVKDFSISKSVMDSFYGDCEVAASVVDACCFKLNHFQDSSCGLKRFFFPTSCAAAMISKSGKSKSLELRKSDFVSLCSKATSASGVDDLSAFKLLFFPVYVESLCFIICVNVEAECFEVLDAIYDGAKSTTFCKSVVAGINSLFSVIDHPKKEHIKRYKSVFQKLAWTNADNIVDSCLYAIRYMETYMGKLDGWEPGFDKDDVSALKYLRCRYCHGLIMWEKNEVMSDVYEKAKQHSSLLNSARN